MTGAPSPERWAIDISLVLNTVLGKDRFPVDVALVAKEYGAHRYPDDPVSLVIGRSLPGFDGALYRAPAGKKGWGIFYNSAIASEGRINFTLGHEFGHYLIHRLAYPDGIRCGEQDVVRWDSEYGQIEHQANVFSAGLLMPLDDFRRQIAEGDKVDLDMISHCADRYRVSLIAGGAALASVHLAPRGAGGLARRLYSVVAGQQAGIENRRVLPHIGAADCDPGGLRGEPAGYDRGRARGRRTGGRRVVSRTGARDDDLRRAI
jgi:IrrE N-terminal-like domain